MQIRIPAASFAYDVGAFCKRFSIPEAILATVYGIFAFLCVLLGPAWFDAADVFKFYHFQFSYTYKLDLVGWCFMVGFLVVLPVTRVLWNRYDLRLGRVSPSSV